MRDHREFVPPEIWEAYGQTSSRFYDPRLALIADAVAYVTGGVVVVNNWHVGGQYKNSGYRTPDCQEGAPLSAHKRGMAEDIKVINMPAPRVQEIVRDNFKLHFEKLGLTGIEIATPTWTHLTVENWGRPGELVEIPYWAGAR